MSTLIAYTTITLGGGDTEVGISIEAENSSIPPAGETKLLVYTTPESYLSKAGVKVTDGNVSGGTIKTASVKDEVVTLTRTDKTQFASGSLSKTPTSTPSYSIISSIGGSASLDFSDNNVTAKNLSVDAIVAKVSYDYKYKEFNFRAPASTSIPVVVAQGFLDV